MALGYFSGGFKYTYVDENDDAVALSPQLSDRETFYWIETSVGYGGFQTLDGRTLSVDDRGYLAAQTEPLDTKGYFEIDYASGGDVLKAHNGKYLRVQADGTIVADGICPDPRP